MLEMTRSLIPVVVAFSVAVPASARQRTATQPGQTGAQPATPAAADSCEPVFEAASYVRGVPYIFVDQGLESLPRLYPRHVLLLQRRYSQIAGVGYSLLVYKQDSTKPDVTVEGMAVQGTRAWRFAALCSAENAMDGLVTTLERVARLPDGARPRGR